MSDILTQLTHILEARKTTADTQTSYVAGLHQKGLNKILEKVGEECVETVIAAKDAQSSGDTTALIHETADLWFHTLVMLSHLGENAESVLQELGQRLSISGLDEKAARHK